MNDSFAHHPIDKAELRTQLTQRIGDSWQSICIVPEEIGDGGEQYMAVYRNCDDRHATHFESAPMSVETAKQLHTRLQKHYKQIVQIAHLPDDASQAILRINVKKAVTLLTNNSFLEATHSNSLLQQIAEPMLAPHVARGRA